MALGRKGLTCGRIKGSTVCHFTYWAVFVVHCKHNALHGCAKHPVQPCVVKGLQSCP
ncbi:unnamed protein product [Staurois parvus]|uniref:Uncharacterized protein n=1 Tax=Staurois parvus TaxID=386267 RepID=A0ABN9AK71_9NEOB|nr:unnamed protein product [Staurois parvus]